MAISLPTPRETCEFEKQFAKSPGELFALVTAPASAARIFNAKRLDLISGRPQPSGQMKLRAYYDASQLSAFLPLGSDVGDTSSALTVWMRQDPPRLLCDTLAGAFRQQSELVLMPRDGGTQLSLCTSYEIPPRWQEQAPHIRSLFAHNTAMAVLALAEQAGDAQVVQSLVRDKLVANARALGAGGF